MPAGCHDQARWYTGNGGWCAIPAKKKKCYYTCIVEYMYVCIHTYIQTYKVHYCNICCIHNSLNALTNMIMSIISGNDDTLKPTQWYFYFLYDKANWDYSQFPCLCSLTTTTTDRNSTDTYLTVFHTWHVKLTWSYFTANVLITTSSSGFDSSNCQTRKTEWGWLYFLLQRNFQFCNWCWHRINSCESLSTTRKVLIEIKGLL